MKYLCLNTKAGVLWYHPTLCTLPVSIVTMISCMYLCNNFQCNNDIEYIVLDSYVGM